MNVEEEGKRLVRLSEGNPGAITVLTRIVTSVPDEQITPIFDEIEKQELTGPKLWIAFKDYGRENVDQTVSAILAHSPGLKNALFVEGYTDFEWKE